MRIEFNTTLFNFFALPTFITTRVTPRGRSWGRRDGDTSDGDNIIGDILRGDMFSSPFLRTVTAALDPPDSFFTGSNLGAATYLPPRNTQRKLHVRMCHLPTSHQHRRGLSLSCFHLVETEPNTTISAPTPQEYLLQKMDFALLEASRSTSGTPTGSLDGDAAHTHTQSESP